MRRAALFATAWLLLFGCASRPNPDDGWGTAPAPPIMAVAPTEEEDPPPAEETPGRAEASGEGEFKRHTLAMIIRIVSEERAEGGAGIGLEYEYRFHEKWGAGAVAEYVAGNLQVGVFAASLIHHPTERWGISLGPGYEVSEEEDRWLVRLGTFYDFEAGEVTIAPAFYVDWLEGGGFATIAGLNFGVKF